MRIEHFLRFASHSAIVNQKVEAMGSPEPQQPGPQMESWHSEGCLTVRALGWTVLSQGPSHIWILEIIHCVKSQDTEFVPRESQNWLSVG